MQKGLQFYKFNYILLSIEYKGNMVIMKLQDWSNYRTRN